MDNWTKNWQVIVYVVGLVFLAGITFANNEEQNKTIAEHSAKLAEDFDERDEAVIRGWVESEWPRVKKTPGG